MKKDEVVIKIIGKLDLMYGNEINQQDVRHMLEEILYIYEIKEQSRALVPMNNMRDRIGIFLASKKIDGLGDRTLKHYGSRLVKFSDGMFKNVEDITTMDIRIYLANYSKTGIKNSTLATETDVLRCFFNWLKDQEYIDRNPMTKIKPIKVESRMRKALSHEELEILRGGCKTPRQMALLEFLYATGCRLEEAENVNSSDIEWSKMQLRVIGKGNKERIVYLNAKAKVYIQKYLLTRLDGCDSLFVTERQPIGRMGRRSIQREIDKIQEQSGLKKNVHPHLLRHSTATHLINRGADLVTVQTILGHSDPATTQIYAQLSNINIAHEYNKYMAN